ncbi:dedicator of cytokinesis protein 2-like isoform X2 [Lepisosteus oculatus]|uniref:dedicator of cytokinesis protein 2-like isoform X2 n=1 Tax=Lepisosteus oculatus TaxID=7918 RepID=UPI003720042D
MAPWTLTTKEKYGVAIWNFPGKEQHCLPLQAGDTVYILELCGGWYRGYTLKNRAVWGIFPASFIQLKNARVEVKGNRETIIPSELPLAQEITCTLREWAVNWKQSYLDGRGQLFHRVGAMMCELMERRSQLQSGTLSKDKLLELQQQVTSQIDQGNRLLKLDLVVRGPEGTVLNPDSTGVVSLYRAHRDTSLRTEQHCVQSEGGAQKVPQLSSPMRSLFLSVRNFVCRVGEETELYMSLHDPAEQRAISENFLIRWASTGLPKEIEKLNNLKVIFTDLGTRDLSRERVLLVCQIVRVGRMDLKETNPRKATLGLRRPLGVSVMDVTDILKGKVESDEEKQHFIPFLQVSAENDFLHGLIRKGTEAKEINHKGQGLWVSLRMLEGDVQQARKEHPHLVDRNTVTARKMGFPEIILPGDVRNDIYVTLLEGEFDKGNKSTQKNVEVTLVVCNEDGEVVPNAISLGAGDPRVSEYCSVVYYQQRHQHWMETVKVSIPIEDVQKTHLRFTFKHRSSSDSKDKGERVFAMAYVRLLQKDGTTLRDGEHLLILYKGDSRKLEDVSQYGSLPCSLGGSGQQHRASNIATLKSSASLNVSTRDSFQISTLTCSTKLTQNVDLLGLLKWRSNPSLLEQNLRRLRKVEGGEVMKFLQDTLDALFTIMMEHADTETYDKLVFDALVFIINLVADQKFQHFNTVLETYISLHFSATLSYRKLMTVLTGYLELREGEELNERLMVTFKSLEYIFKFIVRSRCLYHQLYEGKDAQQFSELVQQFLQALCTLMSSPREDSIILAQGYALRYVPTILKDLSTILDVSLLSVMLKNFFQSLPADRLVKQRLQSLNAIVGSPLFTRPECRDALLPGLVGEVQALVASWMEEETCLELLGSVLELLHKPGMGETHAHMQLILEKLLRPVTQRVMILGQEHPLSSHYVACMTAILSQVDDTHYRDYIQSFPTRQDLMDYLMETFIIFKDLVRKDVYPQDWTVMAMVQNRVFLRAITQFAETLCQSFLQGINFELQLWNNFFHLSVAFLTQRSLQLETFSPTKRAAILCRYGDMRGVLGATIRDMWNRLGQHKMAFIPDLVGPLLEVTLVPEPELQRLTLPLFYDMMLCEYNIRGNFNTFEDEIIKKLDSEVEGGRGDQQYKLLFQKTLLECNTQHPFLAGHCQQFVTLVTGLMERLLDYRAVMYDDNEAYRMRCTVNLLNFYKEIDRQEMYIRYLHKLRDLHLRYENYTEAAFTLLLHAKLLKWSDEPFSAQMQGFETLHTHRQVKESLYNKIIDYFDKGKMWEEALVLCKELAQQYENEIFDYEMVSAILQVQAKFYQNIMTVLRPSPDYFAVGYYGLGFPSFLRNKVFIHRGREYERREDFELQLLSQFPSAERMKSTAPPTEDIHSSPGQYIQCFTVQPVLVEPAHIRNQSVPDQILDFYKVNKVKCFTYSRPIRKGPKDPDNEFASMWIERTTYETAYKLPDILRWYEVISMDTVTLSPVEVAVETMQSTNEKIARVVRQHRGDARLPVSPMSMLLNGIVDAAVMGGFAKYEKAFFTEEYMRDHPEEKGRILQLQDLIAWQIPLLAEGIELHGQRVTEDLRPFHQRMEECFSQLRSKVEKQYGMRQLPGTGGGRPRSMMTLYKPLSPVSQVREEPKTKQSRSSSVPKDAPEKDRQSAEKKEKRRSQFLSLSGSKSASTVQETGSRLSLNPSENTTDQSAVKLVSFTETDGAPFSPSPTGVAGFPGRVKSAKPPPIPRKICQSVIEQFSTTPPPESPRHSCSVSLKGPSSSPVMDRIPKAPPPTPPKGKRQNQS